jgi:hypothetical protein
VFCPKCNDILAILREATPIYILFVPIGQEAWEAVRCSGCGWCWHRKVVRNTGLLERNPRCKVGISVGEPILEDLSPIPPRFSTSIPGKGSFAVVYRTSWWTGEKWPGIVFSRDEVSFPERSCGWQEVVVGREDIVSITTSTTPDRLFCVTIHTDNTIPNILEMVDAAHATWIGKVLSLWSLKPFHQPSGGKFRPSSPPLMPD